MNEKENPYYKELLSLIKLLEFEIFQDVNTITYKKFIELGWLCLEFHMIDNELHDDDFFFSTFNYKKNEKMPFQQLELNAEFLMFFRNLLKKEIRQKKIDKLIPKKDD